MLVAIPTGTAGGHVGVAGLLNEAVTVTAIHAQLSGVDLVRKSNGLRWHVADAGILLGKIIIHPTSNPRTHKEEADKKLQRQGICPAGKGVGHFQSRVWMEYRLVKFFTSGIRKILSG